MAYQMKALLTLGDMMCSCYTKRCGSQPKQLHNQSSEDKYCKLQPTHKGHLGELAQRIRADQEIVCTLPS